MVYSYLADSVDGLEDKDGDGVDFFQQRVMFCVGCELSAQAKV